MSAFLAGRVTHELMARYWPTADQDPASTRPVREFARIWRYMPKIAFSRTLETSTLTGGIGCRNFMRTLAIRPRL